MGLLTSEDDGSAFLRNVGIRLPVTQHHVPEERNPHHSAAKTSELAGNILVHQNKVLNMTIEKV
jgi:hypothetical protein